MLVVGGGPTGLATAVELGLRGIECVVVEPRRTISHSRPRAKTTSIRTMEHFRRWGLADRLRSAAYLPVAWSQDIVFCDTLLGHEVTRFTGCFGLSTERHDDVAETSQQVPQPVVEEVLRDAASELGGVTLALGERLSGLEQGDDRVRSTIVDDDGRSRTVVTEYVVGCDGTGSTTRSAIGATYVGDAHPRPNLTALFRAPGLAELVPHGPAIQYWTLTPAAPSYMGRLDLEQTWWIGLIGAEEGADVAALIDAAVGRPIGAVVLGTDPWVSRTRHASTYGDGRVFLAGDAAHANPPWGGHGFNTGIGDAVNIGWKLAAVLDGWGAPGLLASYEEERRPIADRTIALAAGHATVLSADLADPRLSADGPEGQAARAGAAAAIQAAKHSEFHGLGLVLGYGYPGSSVIVPDGTPPPPDEVETYRPTAHPGHRLPHAWRGSRSLYDELGSGFSLVRAGDDDPAELLGAAAERGVPLELVDLPGQDARSRYGAALLLVRPDQHVAWRGDAPPDPAAIVDRVRGAAAPARK